MIHSLEAHVRQCIDDIHPGISSAIEEVPVLEASVAEMVLEINAVILTGDQKRPTIEVFSWKAEKHPVPEFQKMTIFVNKITMRE